MCPVIKIDSFENHPNKKIQKKYFKGLLILEKLFKVHEIQFRKTLLNLRLIFCPQNLYFLQFYFLTLLIIQPTFFPFRRKCGRSFNEDIPEEIWKNDQQTFCFPNPPPERHKFRSNWNISSTKMFQPHERFERKTEKPESSYRRCAPRSSISFYALSFWLYFPSWGETLRHSKI